MDWSVFTETHLGVERNQCYVSTNQYAMFQRKKPEMTNGGHICRRTITKSRRVQLNNAGGLTSYKGVSGRILVFIYLCFYCFLCIVSFTILYI